MIKHKSAKSGRGARLSQGVESGFASNFGGSGPIGDARHRPRRDRRSLLLPPVLLTCPRKRVVRTPVLQRATNGCGSRFQSIASATEQIAHPVHKPAACNEKIGKATIRERRCQYG